MDLRYWILLPLAVIGAVVAFDLWRVRGKHRTLSQMMGADEDEARRRAGLPLPDPNGGPFARPWVKQKKDQTLDADPGDNAPRGASAGSPGTQPLRKDGDPR